MQKIAIWFQRLIFESAEDAVKPDFFDGDGVKLVFDHVRNFTLASAVAAAGVYACTLDDVNFWGNLITKAFGCIFFLASFSLAIVNFLHGERLLNKAMAQTRLRKGILFLYWIFYFVSVISALLTPILFKLKNV